MTKKIDNGKGGIKNGIKIVQTHEVPSWHVLVNAVYPSIVEHRPTVVKFEVLKKKGTKFI